MASANSQGERPKTTWLAMCFSKCMPACVIGYFGNKLLQPVLKLFKAKPVPDWTQLPDDVMADISSRLQPYDERNLRLQQPGQFDAFNTEVGPGLVRSLTGLDLQLSPDCMQHFNAADLRCR
ncbi:hypothetical protein WJX72_007307 [[Myrmecia] bisecta]|uniref:Uncharacterized protein n=1 Tax=[Myrmecia] bisecta TaxID=41462 RepID=A0AAW1Q1A0_9CHLO